MICRGAWPTHMADHKRPPFSPSFTSHSSLFVFYALSASLCHWQGSDGSSLSPEVKKAAVSGHRAEPAPRRVRSGGESDHQACSEAPFFTWFLLVGTAWLSQGSIFSLACREKYMDLHFIDRHMVDTENKCLVGSAGSTVTS